MDQDPPTIIQKGIYRLRPGEYPAPPEYGNRRFDRVPGGAAVKIISFYLNDTIQTPEDAGEDRTPCARFPRPWIRASSRRSRRPGTAITCRLNRSFPRTRPVRRRAEEGKHENRSFLTISGNRVIRCGSPTRALPDQYPVLRRRRPRHHVHQHGP